MSKKRSKKLVKGLKRLEGFDAVVKGAAKPALWAGYATAVGAVESLVEEGRGGKKTKKRRKKALKAIRKLAKRTGGRKALRVGKLPKPAETTPEPVNEPDSKATVARLIGTPDTQLTVEAAAKETHDAEPLSNVVPIGAGRAAKTDAAIAPGGVSEPLDGVGDKLQMINGIGPILEEKLHQLGVWHYEQIAAWTAQDIAWVDEHLSFHGRIEREDWVAQAAALSRAERPDLGSEPR